MSRIDPKPPAIGMNAFGSDRSAPGCDGDSRNPDTASFSLERLLRA